VGERERYLERLHGTLEPGEEVKGGAIARMSLAGFQRGQIPAMLRASARASRVAAGGRFCLLRRPETTVYGDVSVGASNRSGIERRWPSKHARLPSSPFSLLWPARHAHRARQ
jgi:hypothetical protein